MMCLLLNLNSVIIYTTCLTFLKSGFPLSLYIYLANLSLFHVVGPMSEQFMLPLGLADVISAALCHITMFFYVGK